MTTTGKVSVNGDFQTDIEVNCSPCPQRKRRLNRRGFHLSNHPLMNLLADKSDQKKSYDENEMKADSSQKRVISLNNVKNCHSEKDESKQSSSIIYLKTSSTEVSSSGDPPPKKKHKPITWP